MKKPDIALKLVDKCLDIISEKPSQPRALLKIFLFSKIASVVVKDKKKAVENFEVIYQK